MLSGTILNYYISNDCKLRNLQLYGIFQTFRNTYFRDKVQEEHLETSKLRKRKQKMLI